MDSLPGEKAVLWGDPAVFSVR